MRTDDKKLQIAMQALLEADYIKRLRQSRYSMSFFDQVFYVRGPKGLILSGINFDWLCTELIS